MECVVCLLDLMKEKNRLVLIHKSIPKKMKGLVWRIGPHLNSQDVNT
jgi:hypothetical protein